MSHHHDSALFSYCESVSWLGMAQPWNVISNIIFLLLATWIWREPSAKLHRYGLVSIAIGSGIWHATAINWTLWLDVGAIVLWAILYTLDAARENKQNLQQYVWLLAGLLGASALCAWSLSPILPMLSGAFIPYVAIMVALAFKIPSLRWWFLLSGFAMLTAIIMREIDLSVCHVIPVGTHFLWHVLAGLSLIAPLHLLTKQ